MRALFVALPEGSGRCCSFAADADVVVVVVAKRQNAHLS